MHYSEKKFSGNIHGHFIGEEAAIYTQILPNGMYLAYRDSDDGKEGMGKTRLDAVVDLVEILSGFDARFLFDVEAAGSVK
jgi:hypothetical protein